MEDALIALIAIPSVFIVFPWIILNHRAKMKQNRGLSMQDEQLLDDLYHAAHRLEDRLNNIERIIAADNPDWRQISGPQDSGLAQRLPEQNQFSSRRTS